MTIDRNTDKLLWRSKDSRLRKRKSCRGRLSILIAFFLHVFWHGEIFLFGREKTTGGETEEMPNAKVLSEKQAIVEQLAERFKNASAGILVDYQGITVAEDTKLRRELSENAVDYSVIKNTLTRFAIAKAGLEGLDPVLKGSTSMATSQGDPIAPIRIISEYSKKMGDRFTVKAAFMEGKILSDQEIAEIAELPSKDVLYAKVLGTMLAPITSLAVVLGQIVEQKGGSIEGAAEVEVEAAAEAPAAE